MTSFGLMDLSISSVRPLIRLAMIFCKPNPMPIRTPHRPRTSTDVLREVDVEPRDGGFELRTRVVLEGELALHRPCDRGREPLLLVGAGQCPERREAGRVVVALHPLEGVVGPVREHRLAGAPRREFVVVRPRGGPVGGLVEGDGRLRRRRPEQWWRGKASPGATCGRCVAEGFDGRGGPPEFGGKVGLTVQ